MFTITDFTDTIGVKIFVQNAEVPELKDAIKKGAFIKVKGKTTVDAFDHDLTVMSVWGIKKITDFRTGRQDTSPVSYTHLITDLLYVVVDPRISLTGKSR